MKAVVLQIPREINDTNDACILRALWIYDKHYYDYATTKYHISTLREIVYRLQVKDKLKELKQIKPVCHSRLEVEKTLLVS